ncbi:uncharacterized protein LOC144109522 [Amblyomma americanum]
MPEFSECAQPILRGKALSDRSQKAVRAASGGTGIVPGLCIEVELRFKRIFGDIEGKLKAVAQVFSSKQGRRCTFLAVGKHLQGHSKHAFINEIPLPEVASDCTSCIKLC